MSDTLKLKLTKNQYNAIFAIASSFSGESSKIAGSKLMELIKDEVQKHANGEELPDDIELDFPKRLLDGFFIGATEKAKDDKITTGDVIELKLACSSLKMKGRFDKFVETELEKIPENTEDFDGDEIEEPFDGE